VTAAPALSSAVTLSDRAARPSAHSQSTPHSPLPAHSPRPRPRAQPRSLRTHAPVVPQFSEPSLSPPLSSRVHVRRRSLRSVFLRCCRGALPACARPLVTMAGVAVGKWVWFTGPQGYMLPGQVVSPGRVRSPTGQSFDVASQSELREVRGPLHSALASSSALARTLSYFLGHTISHSHAHTLTCSFTHSYHTQYHFHTHTHAHFHSHSLTHAHTHTHTFTHTHSHTYTFTHTHSLTHSHNRLLIALGRFPKSACKDAKT
jgi:hypothetical protein